MRYVAWTVRREPEVLSREVLVLDLLPHKCRYMNVARLGTKAAESDKTGQELILLRRLMAICSV